ncbi:MAG: MEDS domain-containing protein [Methanosarcinales archaeon]|nr:MEDS domain-containing protein [Methanosarcinales archaeon]
MIPDSMGNEKSDSDIDFVTDMPSGSHFNLFYDGMEEFIELVPSFLKGGIENHDFCFWEVYDPLTVDEAKNILYDAGIDVDLCISSGQLFIAPYTRWFAEDGKYDYSKVFTDLGCMYENAIASGFKNMRVTGDSSMISKDMWADFIDFEKEINDFIHGEKMIALCSYSLGHCSKSQVLDAIGNHEGTIIKKDNHWTIMKDVFKKRYEKNIADMKNYLDTVVKMSCDGIFVLDENMKFEFCNDACFDILGWPEKELMGESFMKVMSSEHHASFLQRWNDAQKGETEPYEISIVRNGGAERNLLISHAPMDFGGAQKHSCIVKDVTRDIGDYIRMIRDDINGYSNPEATVLHD